MTDYDPTDRKHIKEAEKAARLAERERQDVVRALLQHPSGRAWYLSILERCHMFAASFSKNALEMAFAEGERNVGLQLLNDIMIACPERYVEMMRERNERDLTDIARRNNANANRRDRDFEPGPIDDIYAEYRADAEAERTVPDGPEDFAT